LGDPVISSEGDLEAVVLFETLDLLAGLLHPAFFTIHGAPGEQNVSFLTRELWVLFFIRVHELLAPETGVARFPGAPSSVSLFSGLEWLCARYPDESSPDLAYAVRAADSWLTASKRVVVWSGALDRHLRCEVSLQQLISIYANLAKHSFLKSTRQVDRVRRLCSSAGPTITFEDSMAARDEFFQHIEGMLQFHSTRLVEYLGAVFLALRDFVARRAVPRTNVVDDIKPPSPTSSSTFHFMYAEALWRFSGYSHERIQSCTPSTSPSFTGEYAQHAGWDDVEDGATGGAI